MRKKLLGPIVMDLSSKIISDREKNFLVHPLVGGVLLFKRNAQTAQEAIALCDAIRRINPDLLIAIDQEGGRVQRLQVGVTQLPASKKLGEYYGYKPTEALRLAENIGWVMAHELAACGLDFSFAPVLDLFGPSEAIKDRSFSSDPEIVTRLAGALISGLKQSGMIAVGKHFPGHGSVQEDSHFTLPIDNRTLPTIENEDLIPFKILSPMLDAMMPAHVLYPKIDDMPVGFSSKWLSYLREQLDFKGVIISDDLSMQGAHFVGDMPSRAIQALDAGCDLLLICNDPEGLKHTLDELTYCVAHHQSERLEKLRFSAARLSLNVVQTLPRWQKTQQLLQEMALFLAAQNAVKPT